MAVTLHYVSIKMMPYMLIQLVAEIPPNCFAALAGKKVSYAAMSIVFLIPVREIDIDNYRTDASLLHS
jgi:hypothetical protein